MCRSKVQTYSYYAANRPIHYSADTNLCGLDPNSIQFHFDRRTHFPPRLIRQQRVLSQSRQSSMKHTPVPEKNRPICIPSAPSRVPDRKEGKGWEGGGDGKQKKKSENKKRAKIGPGGGRSRRNRMEESWNPWVGKSHPFGGCDTGAMIS